MYFSKSEVSLLYMVSSKTVRDTQLDPVSKTNKQIKLVKRNKQILFPLWRCLSQGLTGPGLGTWSLPATAHKLDSTLDCAQGHPKAVVSEKNYFMY